MPSPRLLWNYPRLDGSGSVQPRPVLRERYGNAGPLGRRIVECAEIALDAAEEPTQQDIRHSLLRLAEDPASAPAGAAEAVEPWLLPFAWWIFGKRDVSTLTHDELAEAALWAWADVPDLPPGRPKRLPLRRALRRMLELVPDWTKSEQDELLLLMLKAFRLGAADDALKLLRNPPRLRGEHKLLSRAAYQAHEYLREARKLTLDEAMRM